MKKLAFLCALCFFCSGLVSLLPALHLSTFLDDCFAASILTANQNSPQDNLTKPMQPDPWLTISVIPNKIKIYPGGRVEPTSTLRFTVKFGNHGTRSMDSVTIRCFPPNMSIPVGRAPLTQWGREISKGPIEIGTPIITYNSPNPKLIEEVRWQINSIPPAAETVIDSNQIVFNLILDISEILGGSYASIDLQCWIGLFYQTNLNQPEAFHVVTIRVEIVPDLEIEKNVGPSRILPGETTTILLNSRNNSQRDLDNVIIRDIFWSSSGTVDQCIEIVSIDTPGVDTTLPDLEWQNLYYKRQMSDWKRIVITVRAKPYEELKTLFKGAPIIITDRAKIIYGTDQLDSSEANFQIVARDLVPKLEPKLFGNYASPGFPLLLHVWISNQGSTPVYEQFSVRIWMNDQKDAPFYDSTISERIEADKMLYLAIESPPLPEGEGEYKFYIEIDYDNNIVEILENNNIDSVLVRAKLQSLKTSVNNSTWSNRVTILGKQPFFPDQIFSYIQITDQNYHYIRGFADANNWSSPDWGAPIGATIRDIWNPLREYHEEDPEKPQANDISLMNVVRIDESDPNGFSVALIIDGNVNSADTSNTNGAARTLVGQMRSKDRLSIIKFSDDVTVVKDFTANRDALMSGIKVPIEGSNYHRLYDAVFRGISETALAHGRKAVLFYTSSPNHGSAYSLNDVIRHADSLGVPVFAFGFGNADQPSLRRLANQTGGIFIYEKETRDIWYIFKLFAEMFKNYYVLAHATTDANQDGTWRLVDVTANYPSLGFADSDIGKYKAPNIGVDLFVVKTAKTDSFSVGAIDTIQFVRPEEIYSYRISYGNLGSNPCYNAQLKDVLPSFVDIRSGTFNQEPTRISADQHQLFWQIHSLLPGEVRSITFDVQVKRTLPRWQIALIDSAFITHEQDEKLENNTSINIVYKIPIEVGPPALRLSPEKIRPYDPIAVELQVFEMMVDWDILIYFEDGTMVDTCGNRFVSTHTPLLPVELADEWYRIIPDFKDTWKRTENEEEKIIFKFKGKTNYNELREAEAFVVAKAEFDCKIHPIIIKPGLPGGPDRVFVDLTMPKDQTLTVSIYNVAGELVRKFPEIRNLRGGEKYEKIVSWDGRDENGNFVASDVYVIIVTAGSNQISKKVIVIR